MMNWTSKIKNTLTSGRGQILLPAVMLAPIFILVIYLLFETSKLSMTKVRQQFALDNGAYSQMSTTSGYLNGLAMINGPLPYRVFQEGGFTGTLYAKKTDDGKDLPPLTVKDAFFQAGAFPSAGYGKPMESGNTEKYVPSAESNDWGFTYYGDSRAGWMKEDPTPTLGEGDDAGAYVMTSKDIADNYFFTATGIGLTSIKEYLTTYLRTGSIYASQNFVYHDTVKNSRMFRESYWLNTKDCEKARCGNQAAETLDRFELESKPFEITETMRFYVTADYEGATFHSGAYAIPIDPGEDLKTNIFQFAYLTPKSRKQLKQLYKGVTLKQKYVLPENRFNINLAQRYQPYVRNTVSVMCPRRNNNCVWPNPISKYSVKVGP